MEPQRVEERMSFLRHLAAERPESLRQAIARSTTAEVLGSHGDLSVVSRVLEAAGIEGPPDYEHTIRFDRGGEVEIAGIDVSDAAEVRSASYGSGLQHELYDRIVESVEAVTIDARGCTLENKRDWVEKVPCPFTFTWRK